MLRTFQLPVFATALVLWGAPRTAEAELLVYEGFDYAAGVNLNGLSATGQKLAGTYATSSLQDLVIS